MKNKRKPKHVLFESCKEAREFLRNQYFNACSVKDKVAKKLQLMEVRVSPEFRVALATLNLKPLKTQSSSFGMCAPKDFSNATSPMHFTEVTHLRGRTKERDFFVDLQHMRQFYDMNHMPGHA